MVRITDILKRAKEGKEAKESEGKADEKRQKESPPEHSQQEVVSPKADEQTKEKAEISDVRISPIVKKEGKITSIEETMELYEETILLIREILKENIDYDLIDAKRITAQIEKIVNQLSLGNEEMLRLGLIKNSLDENYLFCHLINVCIFSIEVGLGVGYERPKLVELGISALLHDIGMPQFLHLSNQPRKLTAEEHGEIKNHTKNGSDILEKIKNLNKTISYVAYHQHERLDGTGYPESLKEESINEYAKIVGLVDTYEAMTHQRRHRNEFSPLETIQEILKDKKSFEYKLIKVLIERIGPFPVGSLVELNTEEIGQVIKLNHKVPLRPVVEVKVRGDRRKHKPDRRDCEPNTKKPKKTRVLDLTAHPTVHIKKTIRKD